LFPSPQEPSPGSAPPMGVRREFSVFKSLLVVGAVIFAIGLSSSVADARSVNIQERTISLDESADGFVISGKATGLAGGFTYEVEVSGTISGSFQCVNNGGGTPDPHQATLGVSGSGTFTASKNGNLIFSVSVEIDAPSPAEACPGEGNNWTVQVISYSGTVNLQICDNACGTPLDTATGIPVSFP
jgi:hypothetical protein